MKLDRVHSIACICSAVTVCLPFLVAWLVESLLASDIPDWGWYAMTALIAVSFGTMAVTFLMRKNRDWERDHGRGLQRRKRR